MKIYSNILAKQDVENADFVAKVRRYQPKGATLKFLDLLDSIGEYDEA